MTPRVTQTQTLAGQQVFHALLGIARARLTELEAREVNAQSVDDVRQAREGIKATRHAINMAERLL